MIKQKQKIENKKIDFEEYYRTRIIEIMLESKDPDFIYLKNKIYQFGRTPKLLKQLKDEYDKLGAE